ncbi:uncharacterized protein N7482_003718 [Penicillium canariense]|uniref:Uncharacterized protein n=1 Tax=Penicillium canariense TaxID=189055 RepID=A0A9W9I7J5_9EURO|nr:uncharacterized protein N7482_003718 [Penicillium canariense]KAJ5168124.1 hypothetical protein N7482_003718 [Penicillium canariense]
MPKHQGSFLKDLPPSIKRCKYHGESQFFDVLNSIPDRFEASMDTSEYVLFHASKETIQTIFDPQNADTSIRRYCRAFDTNEELILAIMALVPHAWAADIMNSMIRDNVSQMGLFSSLRGYPGALTERKKTKGKAPDYGWGPKRTARGQPLSPSVTLEIAMSETEPKLNSDVRFWLNPDEGNADICLTLRINRSKPEIRIEKWVWQNDRIHRSQVTWITKKGEQTNVSHHPIVISFESLFGRQPTCPREKDVEISQQQLEEIAETIWEGQDW